MQTSPDNNERDLRLLRENPGEFLAAIQEMVRIVVRKFVLSGLFSPEEFDDTLQNVNEELLKRLEAIRSHYNGSSLVRTYVSAVIRNICLKMHKTRNRQPRFEALSGSETADPPEYEEEIDKSAILQRTRRLFRAILRQFDHGTQLPRMLLFLKLRFRIPVTRDDILSWYPACREGDLDRLLARFGGEYEELEEKEIYRIMSPVANRAEGKSNSEDALRKWIMSRIVELVELLNCTPGGSRFDEDSLKVLLEDYFSPFLRG